MSASRRSFLGHATALGILYSLLSPEDLAGLGLQDTPPASQDRQEELPHSSTGFWNGFYDSVTPGSPGYGAKAGGRDAGSLVDPALETQYLHYNSDTKSLRYATAVAKEELLDYDGDVAVSMVLNRFRPNSTDSKDKAASQLRVDASQTRPFLNILPPLAWTALASLEPSKAGKLPSLDQIGFKSDQVMTASTHVLLTQGSGKIAVNISRAARDSTFLKVLNVMISAAKMAAPFVALPAVSTPAMSAFSEVFSYWEQRTRFLINGNLMSACATQQAMSDPEIKSPYIGLPPGDFVVVAKKDTPALQAVISKLHVFQGYLVHEDTDLNQPIDKLMSDPMVPDISYATLKIGVTAAVIPSASKKQPKLNDSNTTPTQPGTNKKKAQ
jgi:hypothetical protein